LRTIASAGASLLDHRSWERKRVEEKCFHVVSTVVSERQIDIEGSGKSSNGEPKIGLIEGGKRF